MTTCGIYKITNMINNKCYIGQSVHIEIRLQHHRNNYDNKNEESYNYHLYRAIRKYGLDNFKFEILEECEEDVLNEREIYWIAYYDSYNNGYNSTLGGSGNLRVDREEFKNYYYKNQPSIKELAKHFNIDRSVASRILKELGLKTLYYVSEEKEKQICDYYLSDKDINLRDVSEKFNIDRDTASRVLKRNGVVVRRITSNASNRNKKILIYDLDGNFVKEDTLPHFKDWLYEKGYTKQKKCKHTTDCLAGKLWQVCSFIIRWYIEDYPLKIEPSNYWDKDGINKNIKVPFDKLKIKDEIYLMYDFKSGDFIKEISYSDLNAMLKEIGKSEDTIYKAINSVLIGQKKSYCGYVFRYYKDDYPLTINVTKDWKKYHWRKD